MARVPIPWPLISELPAATETFCGRKSELLAIACTLDPRKPGQKGVVLCGIGGSGKTQLVLRYIEDCRHHYTAILWINASTAEHTMQSFAAAADIVSSSWPSRDLPLPSTGSSKWHKVIARLRYTCHTRWLLVIDSIDDLDRDNFRQYIPTCNHGSVIATSTQSQAPEVLRLSRLEVDRLDLESSRELLFTCAFGSIENAKISEDGKGCSRVARSLTELYVDSKTATTIVKELNGLPLAIEQAGTLLKKVFSFSEFLAAYRAHYCLLMDEYPSRGILSYDKERSITAVFDILYRSIQKRNPEAAAVLTFVAILGPWQIPMSLMEKFQLDMGEYENAPDEETKLLQRALSDRTILRLALNYLADLCLVKLTRNRALSCQSFSLHKAVCEWCVEVTAHKKQYWIIQATHALAVGILCPSKRCVNMSYG